MPRSTPRAHALSISASIIAPTSTGSNLRAAELRIEPRRLGDVGDQPVEPVDIVAHDREQLSLQLGVA